ncbi:16S rRNA (uracil(1498)-N(3))-methyltransferase [Aquirhabdus parva]|uniref:Ribosomal RNA small subunit methyltransferase E methyltransferase domain-containing protein n=1 Tax=Aquirhabdus parva TaxID=2283318 RepID=A0A345PB16_9GAMM|nr:16S rRNA (uracil(1498)-N(3))-methyltransferase [Aquirhabdus parva]AXI04475.1 hypothetical protein HYN46_02500 [Aquirhabdus parva]
MTRRLLLFLEKSDSQSVSLGQRILRTETAVPLLIGRLMG